jgi:hypothetical protein
MKRVQLLNLSIGGALLGILIKYGVPILISVLSPSQGSPSSTSSPLPQQSEETSNHCAGINNRCGNGSINGDNNFSPTSSNYKFIVRAGDIVVRAGDKHRSTTNTNETVLNSNDTTVQNSSTSNSTNNESEPTSNINGSSSGSHISTAESSSSTSSTSSTKPPDQTGSSETGIKVGIKLIGVHSESTTINSGMLHHSTASQNPGVPEPSEVAGNLLAVGMFSSWWYIRRQRILALNRLKQAATS